MTEQTMNDKITSAGGFHHLFLREAFDFTLCERSNQCIRTTQLVTFTPLRVVQKVPVANQCSSSRRKKVQMFALIASNFVQEQLMGCLESFGEEK